MVQPNETQIKNDRIKNYFYLKSEHEITITAPWVSAQI